MAKAKGDVVIHNTDAALPSELLFGQIESIAPVVVDWENGTRTSYADPDQLQNFTGAADAALLLGSLVRPDDASGGGGSVGQATGRVYKQLRRDGDAVDTVFFRTPIGTINLPTDQITVLE